MFILFSAMPALATEYFVATTGDDANPGTADAPFATPQHGLDLAQPGDIVTVGPGRFRGRLVVPRSGAPGAPIVLQGKEGAILDGGDVLRGWEPAPEIGDGVFQKTDMTYIPESMTWNDRYLVRIGGGYEGTDDITRGYLASPADDPFWDGVEATYTMLADENGYGVGYVRFRDGRDPDDEDVTFAPGWIDGPSYLREGVVTLRDVSHVVVRGLELRNADVGVAIYGDSNDNVVENDAIYGGYANVMLYDELGVSGARNVIRNNELTLGYILDDFGVAAFVDELSIHVWSVFKGYGFGDRTAIKLYMAGVGTEVYGNHLYRVWDGITDKGDQDVLDGGAGLDIHHNLVEYAADDALSAGGTLVDCQWHDNVVMEATALINVNFYSWTTGPAYFYRNRLSQVSAGLDFSPKGAVTTDARLFFYHNSFSGNFVTIDAGLYPSLAPNLEWIDNAFSSALFFNDNSGAYWFDLGVGSVDYSWIGGLLDDLPFWQSRSWLGDHNMLAPGQRLWTPPTAPDYLLAEDSPARELGIDVSQDFVLDGETVGALPGFEPGYYLGASPDAGAFQYGVPEPPPVAPTRLTAALVADDVAELAWYDDSYDETGFLLERKIGDGDFEGVATIGRNQVHTTDVGLPAASTITWRLRADSPFGPSEPSNEATLVTPGAPDSTDPGTTSPQEDSPDPSGAGETGGCGCAGGPGAGSVGWLVVGLAAGVRRRRQR